MRSDTKVKRASVRKTREDGDATKNRIIEAAGQLFAKKGYAETTSKEICETVGVNMAAVNYYFGSRDGLYIAILEQVRDYLTDHDSLGERIRNAKDATEKLGIFIDSLLRPVFERQSWKVRLWARELVSPSAVGLALKRERTGGTSDFAALVDIVAEITGIPVDDPLVYYCVLSIMGPFMVLLVVGPGKGPHEKVFAGGEKLAKERLKEFFLGGLKAFAVKYGKPEISVPNEPQTLN